MNTPKVKITSVQRLWVWDTADSWGTLRAESPRIPQEAARRNALLGNKEQGTESKYRKTSENIQTAPNESVAEQRAQTRQIIKHLERK